MTTLYINGVMVELPKEFNLTITQENPYYSKNGSWSFDIDLSLNSATNAELFAHIERLNASPRREYTFTCQLYCDARMLLDGTGNIVSWGEKSVKLKLMSGNSELNFLIGGERMLRDLDLGTADVSPYEAEKIKWWDNEQGKINGAIPQWKVTDLIYEHFKQAYPQRGWQLLPFFYEDEEYIGNMLRLDCIYGETLPKDTFQPIYFINRKIPLRFNYEVEFNQSSDIPVTYNYVPQPYLCFIIDKVIEALGYSIGINALADNAEFRKLYIVHAHHTLEFAKMLPDWTVTEFFEKLERTFSLTIFVNEANKKIDIMHLWNGQSDTISELIVDDAYTVEVDEEAQQGEDAPLATSNVGYDLTTVGDHKYAQASQSLLAKGRQVAVQSIEELCRQVERANSETALRANVWTLPNGEQYIAREDWYKYVPQKVGYFRPLMQNPKSEQVDQQLDIIPAPMKASKYIMPQFLHWHLYQIPVAIGGDNYIKEEPASNTIEEMADLIEQGDETPQKSGGDKMLLAMFDGLQRIPVYPDKDDDLFNVQPLYPVCYTESRAAYTRMDVRGFETAEYGAGNNPFRLQTMQANLWSKEAVTRPKEVYKFTIYDAGVIHVQNKFLINGRLFRLKKLEWTVTERGLYPACRGEFYPIDLVVQ